MDIDAVVQERLDNDADFQNSLVELSDEDKAQAIEEKRREVVKSEFASLVEKAKKNEEIARDQKIRAEKAEELAKNAKQTQKQEVEGLSQKDVIYLAKTDIHEDDIDEVVEYAKLKKITVADAHKFYKPILAERDEERKTAQATQTKGGARTTSKITPEAILEKAVKGQISDSDDEIALLAEARRKQERAKLGK